MKRQLGTDEARRGQTSDRIRYMLAIGLLLVIAGFAAVYTHYFV